MFKVNNKDTRTTPSGIFIVNVEHISHLVLVSIANFELVNAGWDIDPHRINFLNL